MQTPPRPSLPGTWLQTPAGKPAPPAPSFTTPNIRNVDPSFTPGHPEPTSLSLTSTDQNRTLAQQQSVTNSNQASKSVNPDERAARAVNEALEGESRFPELDGYLSRMSSSIHPFTIIAEERQTATLLSMTYSPLRHGRLSRKSEFTTYLIRYLNSTIELPRPPVWDCLRK
jgi:hypothetical protein